MFTHEQYQLREDMISKYYFFYKTVDIFMFYLDQISEDRFSYIGLMYLKFYSNYFLQESNPN